MLICAIPKHLLVCHLFVRIWFTTKSYISVMAINCVYNVCNLYYTGCKLNSYGVFIKLWRHHCMQFTVDKVHRKQMNIGAMLLLYVYQQLHTISLADKAVLCWAWCPFLCMRELRTGQAQMNTWHFKTKFIMITDLSSNCTYTLIDNYNWYTVETCTVRGYLHKHLRKCKYT